MAEVLRGANTTAQWYQNKFPGSTVFGRLEKFLLHSTETEGWPGYAGGASAPNATYHPRRREIRQHFENNRSSRALRDPSGTAVRENRDNVFQLEIVAYSDARLASTVDGLWIGDLTDAHFTDLAWIAIQLHQDWDLPLKSVVTWNEGSKTPTRGVRLSGSQYDAARGILAHMHASGNEHWDVGGFRYSRLAAKIAQLVTPTPPKPPPLPTFEDDDMQLFLLGATAYRAVYGDRYLGVPKDQADLWVKAGVKPLPITAGYDAVLREQLGFEGDPGEEAPPVP